MIHLLLEGTDQKAGQKSDQETKPRVQRMKTGGQPHPETQSFSINANPQIPIHHAMKNEFDRHATCLTKGPSFVIHVLFDLLFYFSRAK
jgi:hypothetical protein